MNGNRITRREFVGRALLTGAAAFAAPAVLRAADPAGAWQLGCFTRPWAAFEYPVAFDAIAEAGFKYVGLMTTKSGYLLGAKTTVDEAHRIGEEAKKRGLGAISAWGGDFGIRTSKDGGVSELRHLVEVASAAGVRNLLLGGVGDQKLVEPYYKAIAMCADEAAAKGVGLTIKPHGGTTGTGGELRRAVERVGKRNFTIWYDAGNIYYYSDGKVSPVEDAPSVAGLVSGWCIKDFSGKPKKSVDLTPGTGEVDFKAVFAKLKAGGFTGGPLVVETLTPGGREELAKEAVKARKLLEGLVA